MEYEIAVSGNLRSGGWVDSEKVLATPRPPEQPVITQVIAGDESLEVHWTYSGDESELSSWRIWYKENSEEGILRHKEIEDESQRSGLLKTERGFKPLVNGLEYEIAVSGNLRSGGLG